MSTTFSIKRTMNCARPVAPEEYNLAGSKNHTVAIAKIAFEIITIPSLNKSSKACFLYTS